MFVLSFDAKKKSKEKRKEWRSAYITLLIAANTTNSQ
jgi:hypothetical protein